MRHQGFKAQQLVVAAGVNKVLFEEMLMLHLRLTLCLALFGLGLTVRTEQQVLGGHTHIPFLVPSHWLNKEIKKKAED